MIGLHYIGYRVAEWLIEAMAKVFVAMAFLVWGRFPGGDFFLPAIVLLLPAWLFDRTRAWGERATGFVLGLILTGTLTLIVARLHRPRKTAHEPIRGQRCRPPGSANFIRTRG